MQQVELETLCDRCVMIGRLDWSIDHEFRLKSIWRQTV